MLLLLSWADHQNRLKRAKELCSDPRNTSSARECDRERIKKVRCRHDRRQSCVCINGLWKTSLMVFAHPLPFSNLMACNMVLLNFEGPVFDPGKPDHHSLMRHSNASRYKRRSQDQRLAEPTVVVGSQINRWRVTLCYLYFYTSLVAHLNFYAIGYT